MAVADAPPPHPRPCTLQSADPAAGCWTWKCARPGSLESVRTDRPRPRLTKTSRGTCCRAKAELVGPGSPTHSGCRFERGKNRSSGPSQEERSSSLIGPHTVRAGAPYLTSTSSSILSPNAYFRFSLKRPRRSGRHPHPELHRRQPVMRHDHRCPLDNRPPISTGPSCRCKSRDLLRERGACDLNRNINRLQRAWGRSGRACRNEARTAENVPAGMR